MELGRDTEDVEGAIYMNKVVEMMKNRPIREKMVRLFELVTVTYVLLAVVGLFETIRG